MECVKGTAQHLIIGGSKCESVSQEAAEVTSSITQWPPRLLRNRPARPPEAPFAVEVTFNEKSTAQVRTCLPLCGGFHQDQIWYQQGTSSPADLL